MRAAHNIASRQTALCVRLFNGRRTRNRRNQSPQICLQPFAPSAGTGFLRMKRLLNPIVDAGDIDQAQLNISSVNSLEPKERRYCLGALNVLMLPVAQLSLAVAQSWL